MIKKQAGDIMEKRNNAMAVNWDICNDILNFLRKIKGQELRSKANNPYKR